MIKLYAAGVAAVKTTNTPITGGSSVNTACAVVALVIRSFSEQEAFGIGYQHCLAHFPAVDGWNGHVCSIAEVED